MLVCACPFPCVSSRKEANKRNTMPERGIDVARNFPSAQKIGSSTLIDLFSLLDVKAKNI